MDIAALSTSMAATRFSNQGSVAVARKALEQQEQEGQNAVALIQRAAPQAENGKGKLVNIYA